MSLNAWFFLLEHQNESLIIHYIIFFTVFCTVLCFVVSGLDINGCVLSYFEGTAHLHLYKLYTHYFTL